MSIIQELLEIYINKISDAIYGLKKSTIKNNKINMTVKKLREAKVLIQDILNMNRGI